jgi:DNA-binding transcriptional LysR family regulator
VDKWAGIFLGHLPINICVARNRSFLAAALELGMSPSAVKQAVRSVPCAA